MSFIYYLNLACLGLNAAAFTIAPSVWGLFWVSLSAAACYICREHA